MTRPLKRRRVAFLPQATYFKPAGVPLRLLDEVILSIEEVEAIRLKDLERLEQGEAAERMNISRSTFQRVLASAQKKIADALLNGKAIRIEGGNFELAVRRFRCIAGHEWEVPFKTMISAPPEVCPECETPSIMPLFSPGMGLGRGGWRRHQGGQG